MPRRTARQEVEQQFEQFFREAKDKLTHDIVSTRQPERRTKLLTEIDALDRVYARFYNWINGAKTDAA